MPGSARGCCHCCPHVKASSQDATTKVFGRKTSFGKLFRTTVDSIDGLFLNCRIGVRVTEGGAGGFDNKPLSGLPPDGEVFLLTAPFIDQLLGCSW